MRLGINTEKFLVGLPQLPKWSRESGQTQG